MTRRPAVSLILSIGGLLLLLWVISSTGIDKIREGLLSVGWGFGAILVLSYVRFLIRSYAWMLLLENPAPLRAAVAATISGDALGNVTPLGLIASEPAKAVYLSRYLPAPQSFAALTAENFFYSVSVAIYICAGGLILLLAFTLTDLVRLTGIASLVSMGLVLAVAGWIAVRKPTAASALLARIPSRRIAQVIDRVERFETRTYGAARLGRARLTRLVGAEIVFHLLSFAECWYTLWLLTGASSPLAALVLDSVNRVMNILFKVIPFKAGVDEYAARMVAEAIVVRPDIAVVMALVRKLRLLIWAAVGFVIWARKPAMSIASPSAVSPVPRASTRL